MAKAKLSRNPHTGAIEVRFHALTQVLGVSIQTLYQWRRGSYKRTPRVPVEVEPPAAGKKKPTVWVDVDKLRHWLSKYRPHLVERLIEYLRISLPPRYRRIRLLYPKGKPLLRIRLLPRGG